MKTQQYKFMEDINKIPLDDKFNDFQDKLSELNDWRYTFSFGNTSDRVWIVQEVLESLDWFNLDSLAINTSFYWCGFLTLEPFDELCKEEETILNMITKYHLKAVSEGYNIFLVFSENKESPLHKFFRKHADGYGQNIPTSINAMMNRIANKFLPNALEKNSDRWGKWEEEPVELDEE